MSEDVAKCLKMSKNVTNRGLNKFGEIASRADSGKLHFWSEPSQSLNLVLNKNTPETVAFTIP